MEKKFNSSKAWLVAIVAILAQVTFAMGLMKVPSNAPLLMQGLGIDPVAFGNLMNANGIVSLIFSIPAGIIMQKIGARNILMLAMGIYIVGQIVGVLAGENYTMLIVSRAIEGLGYGMQSSAVPQFISEWFPAQKRGLPSGIDSIWFSVGQLIILNLAAHLPGAAEGSWLGSWWFVIIVQVIWLVVVFLFAKSPSEEENQLDEVIGGEKPSLAQGIASPTTWLVLGAFLCFGYVNSAFASFFPNYLQNFFGMDMAGSNSMTSVATVAMLVAGIVGGFVLNAIKATKRPVFLFVLVIVVGICGLAMFNLPSTSVIIPFLIVMGIFFQVTPATCYSILPEAAASPETLPTSMGIMSVGQGLGGVFGTLITSIFLLPVPEGTMVTDATTGAATPLLTWSAMTIPNAVVFVISFISAILLIILMKKQYEKRGML